MTDLLIGLGLLPPAIGVVLALLALGSAGHALALLARRRRRSGWARGLAAVAQAVLLVALAGATARQFGMSDPAAWLPVRSADAVQAAGWLALLLFLVAGAWWRAPGMAVTAPLVVLALFVVADVMRGGATPTSGLALVVALRPAYRAVAAAALGVGALGLAGLAARWLERWALGEPVLSRRAVVGVLTGAALLQTGLIALGVEAWLTRGRAAPPWTVQQTWLVASWLALALAVEAGWRRRSALPALAVLGIGLLVVNLVVVSGVGPRSSPVSRGVAPAPPLHLVRRYVRIAPIRPVWVAYPSPSIPRQFPVS